MDEDADIFEDLLLVQDKCITVPLVAVEANKTVDEAARLLQQLTVATSRQLYGIHVISGYETDIHTQEKVFRVRFVHADRLQAAQNDYDGGICSTMLYALQTVPPTIGSLSEAHVRRAEKIHESAWARKATIKFERKADVVEHFSNGTSNGGRSEHASKQFGELDNVANGAQVTANDSVIRSQPALLGSAKLRARPQTDAAPELEPLAKMPKLTVLTPEKEKKTEKSPSEPVNPASSKSKSKKEHVVEKGQGKLAFAKAAPGSDIATGSVKPKSSATMQKQSALVNDGPLEVAAQLPNRERQSKTETKTSLAESNSDLFSADTSPESSPVRRASPRKHASTLAASPEIERKQTKEKKKMQKTSKKKSVHQRIGSDSEDAGASSQASFGATTGSSDIVFGTPENNRSTNIVKGKAVPKTFVDSDGYLVTQRGFEKTVVSVDDTSTSVPQRTSPRKAKHDTKQSPAKLQDGKRSPAKGSGKASPANMKGKAATATAAAGKKQSSLTSFFKK